jgi:hypothetical protein
MTSDDSGNTGLGGAMQDIDTVAIHVLKTKLSNPTQWTIDEPLADQGGWYVGDFNGDGNSDLLRILHGADLLL